MKIAPEQFERNKHVFPVQQGNVSIDNLQLLNAILYVTKYLYPQKRWNKACVLTTVLNNCNKEQMMGTFKLRLCLYLCWLKRYCCYKNAAVKDFILKS